MSSDEAEGAAVEGGPDAGEPQGENIALSNVVCMVSELLHRNLPQIRRLEAALEHARRENGKQAETLTVCR